MHFGFALDSLDIDLWNVDLSDTYLDLLDTDVLNRPSVCLPDVLKNFFFYNNYDHIWQTNN